MTPEQNLLNLVERETIAPKRFDPRAYPEASTTSQNEGVLPHDCKLRKVKYLNNITEQYHRFIKKRVRACLGYCLFDTAKRTQQGVEAMNMMRKGQVKRLDRKDAMGQAKFIESLFRAAT